MREVMNFEAVREHREAGKNCIGGKTMDRKELSNILENHKKWVGGKEGGVCADLRGADLRDIDLSGTDLSGADLIGIDLSGAILRDVDLRYTNLRYADLRDADLSGADLDYSCLPLWCGSLGANFDDRQLVQIAYHLVRAGLNSKNASDETKKELSKLIDFANKFHRVKECGRIKKEVEE